MQRLLQDIFQLSYMTRFAFIFLVLLPHLAFLGFHSFQEVAYFHFLSEEHRLLFLGIFHISTIFTSLVISCAMFGIVCCLFILCLSFGLFILIACSVVLFI